MTYQELYENTLQGNAEAFETIESNANNGVAEAQFLLSCIYDGFDSPYRDVNHGIQWLQKAAQQDFELAKKKQINMVHNQSGLDWRYGK